MRTRGEPTRCPFCLVRLEVGYRGGRRSLRGRLRGPACRPCGAYQRMDEASACCPPAQVWFKAGVRMCAGCGNTGVSVTKVEPPPQPAAPRRRGARRPRRRGPPPADES
ncbi:MAG: hypothetical protein H6713_35785 [Myxococcales bacterium]|nr:hypothetical protein [Myxococcales bacterium]MCB9755333.1 hypothetical protein [Myxococcales bacterium]